MDKSIKNWLEENFKYFFEWFETYYNVAETTIIDHIDLWYGPIRTFLLEECRLNFSIDRNGVTKTWYFSIDLLEPESLLSNVSIPGYKSRGEALFAGLEMANKIILREVID